MTQVHWLYRIVFPNTKLYIGLSKNPEQRWKDHKKNAEKGLQHLVYNAMRKWGTTNCKFELLCAGPQEYIKALEIAAIKEFKTQDRRFGYNITNGGDTSPVEIESVRKKISAANKGKKPSVKAVANSVAARKGKKLSSETIAKLSEIRIGHSTSQETKVKISQTLQGHPVSEEVKAKISKTLMGRSPTEERRVRSKIGVQKWWDARRGELKPDEYYEALLKQEMNF